MASFDRALAFTFENEGGFVNDPIDRGGATRFGVTQATLARFRRRPVTVDEVAKLTREDATLIYRSLYWDAIKGDQITNQKVATMLFDQAVSSGPGAVVPVVQTVVGASPDGVIGPKTIAAINQMDPVKLILEFVKSRQLYYGRIVENDAIQKRFLIGWLTRTHRLLDFALCEKAAAPAALEPKWLQIARGENGQKEISGGGHNSRILEYHATTTLKATDDETPWCSAFVNFCITRTGLVGTDSAVARSWLGWGEALVTPTVGCVAVFKRPGAPWAGHVGFYISETDTHVKVLGGNQNDGVCIAGFLKRDLLGYRLPVAVEVKTA